jgi:hypothetical protein
MDFEGVNNDDDTTWTPFAKGLWTCSRGSRPVSGVAQYDGPDHPVTPGDIGVHCVSDDLLR